MPAKVSWGMRHGSQPHALICESCGYPLERIASEYGCPECGKPSTDSDPAARVGQAWDRRFSIKAYLSTWGALLLRPGHAARRHRFSRSNIAPRLFALGQAMVCGAMVLAAWLGWGGTGLSAVLAGMVSVKAILLATYFEVIGVWWVSRRHGWRVPLRHAERLAAYASVGWPASVILLLLYGQMVRQGTIERFINVFSAAAWAYELTLAASVMALALALMLYETLVWQGARRCRWANSPRPDARQDPSEQK